MNYKEIIKNITDEDIKNLFKSIGVDPYEETEKYIIFPTVCHHKNKEDGSNKLYYYKDTKIFYCYTNCGPMSIIQLVKKICENHNKKFNYYRDFQSNFKIKIDTNIFIDEEEDWDKLTDKYNFNKVNKLKVYNDKILDIYDNEYFPIEWRNDNISIETMKKYNIRYDYIHNSIIIPHYNNNNELVGIRCRTLEKQIQEQYGKYLPVKIENKLYNHQLMLNLYGLNKTKENIKKYGYAFIFEGEDSLLSAFLQIKQGRLDG